MIKHKCPKCGIEFEDEPICCPNCGAKFAWKKEKEVVPPSEFEQIDSQREIAQIPEPKSEDKKVKSLKSLAIIQLLQTVVLCGLCLLYIFNPIYKGETTSYNNFAILMSIKDNGFSVSISSITGYIVAIMLPFILLTSIINLIFSIVNIFKPEKAYRRTIKLNKKYGVYRTNNIVAQIGSNILSVIGITAVSGFPGVIDIIIAYLGFGDGSIDVFTPMFYLNFIPAILMAILNIIIIIKQKKFLEENPIE